MNLSERFHALLTVLKGDKVPFEIYEERVAKCEACGFSKLDAKGIRSCGLCGCAVEKLKVFNLALYKEDLPKHGCKHPYRGLRKTAGWRQ